MFCVCIDWDWKMARKQKQSPLHILEPVDLTVVFSRAMVVTDSRMAKSVWSFSITSCYFIFCDVGLKILSTLNLLFRCLYLCSRFKMSGELHLLSLRISDVKLRNVLELVDSIPLPESIPAANGSASSSKVRTVQLSLNGSIHILCWLDELPNNKYGFGQKTWCFELNCTHVKCQW